MAFQPAPDCAEVVFLYQSAGQNINNVVNFKFATPYTQSDLDQLTDAMDNWVGVNMKPTLPNTVSYVSTTARGLSDSIDLESVNNDNAGAGSAASPALPNNVTFCLSFRTGLTGRSARGRFYWPILNEAELETANTITALVAAAMQTSLYQMQTDAGAAGWTMGVLSRQHAGVVLPEAQFRPLVSVIFVDRTVDSMRRRLPGRGT